MIPAIPLAMLVGLARERVFVRLALARLIIVLPAVRLRPSPGSTAVFATLEPRATITLPGQGSSSSCDLHVRASGRESRRRRSGS